VQKKLNKKEKRNDGVKQNEVFNTLAIKKTSKLEETLKKYISHIYLIPESNPRMNIYLYTFNSVLDFFIPNIAIDIYLILFFATKIVL